MSFTSLLFYVCLLPAGILFYVVPGKFRSLYLLLLSYALYAYWSPIYLGLLILASALVYALGLGISGSDSEKKQYLYLVLGVVVVVAVLAAFKAAGAWKGVLLPLGLSYYTFKLISYLIEVYWGAPAERDPVLFFLYPAFFPQIVSGPIQRPESFFDQMRDVTRRKADNAQIETGYGYILGGLMLKMLVGDRLGAFVDVIDASHGDYRYAVVIMTVGCYTLQLFADFAGYTNIAIGIGKIFGIDSPQNFNAPFAATNIQEMWRRWHMTLTSWVTDYLFTPLSMSLRDLGQFGLVLCIWLNMVIIGLWHGLTLNFLVFGLLHALFVSVTVFVLMAHKRYIKPVAGTPVSQPGNDFLDSIRSKMSGLLGAALTFALMSFSQIFWHSPTWDQAISILQQVVGLTPSGARDWIDIGPGVMITVYLCAAVSLYVGAGSPGADWLRSRLNPIVPKWAIYGLCIFLLSALTTESAGKFVYGQF